MKKYRERLFTSTLLLMGIVTLAPARATASETNVEKLAKELIELRGQTETLHDRIVAKQQDHRNRMASLSQRRAELEAQLQRQQLSIEKLRREVNELRTKAGTVEEQSAALQPVALDSAGRLEAYVASALPFTVDERLAEIAKVRDKLSRGELSAPRALNQLWTFVEDELRLSRENAMSRQTIQLEGKEQLADVVRLGMAMLFFRTGDGRYGHAQRSGEQWTYTLVAQTAGSDTEALFESFEKQVRTGFFRIPNALPRSSR